MKIKCLRIKASRGRRDKPTRMDQPSEIKRKVGNNKYMRVLRNTPSQDKRKEEEVLQKVQEHDAVEKKNKTFPILNTKRRKKNKITKQQRTISKGEQEKY